MKKPTKPIVNENLFILFISIVFTFGFISIFKFEYSWAVGFIFYWLFAEFYSLNYLSFLKPFLYTSVSKYKSKLFKGNYYEYITANCKRISFYKNKLHSEHNYGSEMKYYLNGFYLNSLSKDPYLYSDCSEYMLSCKNYIEENEFHLAIWEKDYNKVKNILKKKK